MEEKEKRGAEESEIESKKKKKRRKREGETNEMTKRTTRKRFDAKVAVRITRYQKYIVVFKGSASWLEPTNP